MRHKKSYLLIFISNNMRYFSTRRNWARKKLFFLWAFRCNTLWKSIKIYFTLIITKRFCASLSSCSFLSWMNKFWLATAWEWCPHCAVLYRTSCDQLSLKVITFGGFFLDLISKRKPEEYQTVNWFLQLERAYDDTGSHTFHYPMVTWKEKVYLWHQNCL